MAIKIKGTKAYDCGVVYDLPADADIEIEETVAIRTEKILLVRNETLQGKIIALVHKDTPIGTIEKFVEAIIHLENKNDESIAIAAQQTDITKFVKPTVGVTNFVGTIVGLLKDLSLI